eukprot:CAMPEP_0205910662 /NCGR_PEP_ID=MMETSP1325-20131115/4586_1 /ASSEMBLY_ACC=CAM_ASM_000708 /TAXON_ID=236786 /ORGANISM="Florenciella sp., Strain RCC1007" /LENGTH=159 /DNA_ID=CAMNT_0053277049 /DNA_START=30 /DNA_END=505 /DNA_ORIENTATION=-
MSQVPNQPSTWSTVSGEEPRPERVLEPPPAAEDELVVAVVAPPPPTPVRALASPAISIAFGSRNSMSGLTKSNPSKILESGSVALLFRPLGGVFLFMHTLIHVHCLVLLADVRALAGGHHGDEWRHSALEPIEVDRGKERIRLDPFGAAPLRASAFGLV